MLSVATDQANLARYAAEFTAKLTAVNVGPTYAYSWTEQTFNSTTKLYEDAPSPRQGTPSKSPAYEVNNALIDVTATPLARMWFRSDVDGDESYEFDSGAALIPVPPPPTTSIDVKQLNPLVDFPNTTTVKFDHRSGIGMNVAAGGPNTVIVTHTLLDVQDVRGSSLITDYPDTAVLQFQDSDGFTFSTPAANTVRIGFTLPASSLLEVWEEPSGAATVDVTGVKVLEFHRADGFRVTSPSAGHARVGFVGSGSSLYPPNISCGIVRLNSQYTATSTLASTGLQIVGLAAGTYLLTACVMARYTNSPSATGNGFDAVLYDVTAGAAITTVGIANYLLEITASYHTCHCAIQEVYSPSVLTTVALYASTTLSSGIVLPGTSLSYLRIA